MNTSTLSIGADVLPSPAEPQLTTTNSSLAKETGCKWGFPGERFPSAPKKSGQGSPGAQPHRGSFLSHAQGLQGATQVYVVLEDLHFPQKWGDVGTAPERERGAGHSL